MLSEVPDNVTVPEVVRPEPDANVSAPAAPALLVPFTVSVPRPALATELEPENVVPEPDVEVPAAINEPLDAVSVSPPEKLSPDALVEVPEIEVVPDVVSEAELFISTP